MPINTVTQQATRQSPEKFKPTSHHCKKPSHHRNQCRQLKCEKEQCQNNEKGAGISNNNGGQISPNSNNKTPKIVAPPYFKIKVDNGQLEKPLATARPKFEIGDKIFAEDSVVMEILTGLIKGSHFRRYNSVVIDTIHGHKHFPHLTMQVKAA